MRIGNTEKVVLVGSAAFVGLLIWQKVRALKNLVFTPGDITGLKFYGSTPVLSLTVLVQNTSSASIAVNSFAGNVFANDTLVGTISNFIPVVIPPNTSVPVNVDIAFQILGLTNNIVNAVSYGNYTQELHIQGAANVLGQQWPVDINFTVGKH